MNAEFDALDRQDRPVLAVVHALKNENQQLRLQLVSAQNDIKLLEGKVDGATTRLEVLLSQIPE